MLIEYQKTESCAGIKPYEKKTKKNSNQFVGVSGLLSQKHEISRILLLQWLLFMTLN